MATIEPTEQRTVLPGAPPYSVDDLLKFPDDGNRYELFNGSLLVSPAPLPPHQDTIFLTQIILHKAAPRHLRAMTTINVRVSEQDFFIPDLAVVQRKAIHTTGPMFSPQDVLLVGEVVSPSTKLRDRALKVEAYAAAGIPTYWRIELNEGPTLYVYTLDGDSYASPIAYKAGTVAHLTEPFPVSFDPAELQDLD
ncbi:Uma2 family endonuclease [Nonomuraea antri]|uniref:Uma2 family endonuclease n=1 Tax=Nonomuraea antri TaxID=2730852 RepID=UPI001F1F9E1F|nr:Uma2 family endonuclease [Nonomuraea antri]